MKTMKIWRLAFAMLAAFSLASCSSDDDNEDKEEQVTVYVSAETGVYYAMWLDPERENPIIGMQIREEGTRSTKGLVLVTMKRTDYKISNQYGKQIIHTNNRSPYSHRG